MEGKYYRMLPAEIAKMVNEIEDKIGSQIIVQAAPRYTSAAEFRDGLGAFIFFYFKNGKWEISINHQDLPLSPCTLTHECLHAVRYFLQDVPFISAALGESDYFGRYIQAYNGDLEHMAIIPIENQFFPEESQSHWFEDIQNSFFFYYDWPRRHLRNNLRRCYMMSHLAIDSVSLRKFARISVKRTGLEDAADRFLRDIVSCQGDKLEQIKTLIRHFNIPKRKLEVLRFDLNLGYVPVDALSNKRYEPTKWRGFLTGSRFVTPPNRCSAR